MRPAAQSAVKSLQPDGVPTPLPRAGDPDPVGGLPAPLESVDDCHTDAAGAVHGLRARIGAYVGLTKPRIIELLLITTVPAMIAAERHVPSIGLAVATLIGGTLAAGSANALNCVIDADIDAVMRRTRTRTLARNLVPTRSALIFGVLLGVAAVGFLWLTTTWQAAALALLAILFYVFVYSLWLKRRTSQNIVWGGLAGCMPVIIGWSAITGGIGWPAWVFFGVIFFWTPPHTWALAMRYRQDYAAAGVPMLPVVATDAVVVRQIVLYSWAMVVCSLALIPASNWIYLAVAAPAGLGFLVVAHRLHRRVALGGETKPMTLFHLSNAYLTLVSVAWAVDAAVGLPVLGWPF